MDEQAKARRRALDIPIHEDESDHIFVSGYCTCGASTSEEKMRNATRRDGGRRGASSLDYIEGNQDNR